MMRYKYEEDIMQSNTTKTAKHQSSNPTLSEHSALFEDHNLNSDGNISNYQLQSPKPSQPFTSLSLTFSKTGKIACSFKSQNTTSKPTITAIMCKYYAHTHPCGHTKTVFAAFCPQSALIQKPCGRGEIWATVKMDKDCSHCYEEPEPLVPRSRTGGRKKIGSRR